jgi:osmotically-inducible protein OsmY
MPATARRLHALIGVVIMLAMTGCDLYIPIFHEDPTAVSGDRSEAARELDDSIRSDILSALVEQEVGTLKNVTVDVYEQTVLLVGTVTQETLREKAAMVASSAQGVEQVINEIQVVEDSSPRDKAEDLSIENRLKAALRDSSAVNSFNLRWHSVNGTVYLFGRATSDGEADAATGIARTVPGVRDIVDHIAVRAANAGHSWIGSP